MVRHHHGGIDPLEQLFCERVGFQFKMIFPERRK
jgi:hypothetical protein